MHKFADGDSDDDTGRDDDKGNVFREGATLNHDLPNDRDKRLLRDVTLTQTMAFPNEKPLY